MDLLNMIPDEQLDFLAEKTEVNYQAKKIDWSNCFQNDFDDHVRIK